MPKKQNPFGLNTVTPYLIVTDVERLVQFLQDVFDGKLRGEINYRIDKTVQHAEIEIGDSIIMLAEPTSEYPEIKLTSCGLYVYVQDCDRVYAKALNNGAISISEPTDHSHGDRYGGVKDFTGNIWWMVTNIAK